jgi:hypothetical protein
MERKKKMKDKCYKFLKFNCSFFNIRLSVFHRSHFTLLIKSKMTTVFLKRKFPICVTRRVYRRSSHLRYDDGLPYTDLSWTKERHSWNVSTLELKHFAENMSPHGCKYFINGQTYRKITFSLPIVKLKDKYPISRGTSIVLPLTSHRKITRKIYYPFNP